MKFALALCLLLATSCGNKHRSEPQESPDSSTLDALLATRDIYLTQLREKASLQGGWISKGCDALLFSALFASALPDAAPFFNAQRAEDQPGHWQRRAVDFGSCLRTGANSTISRDMFWGLAWWAWRAKQKDVVERLIDYGEHHAWVMGESDGSADGDSKVVLTPALAGMFYQILYRLGGTNHPSRHIPDYFPSGLKGFEAHLLIEGILLHAEIDDGGGATDTMLERLKEQAGRQPLNPFFAAALARFTGDPSAALQLLSNEAHWPKDHLPTAENHCGAWVIQRDYGLDWQPCPTPDLETLYGADFIWTVDILTRGPKSID